VPHLEHTGGDTARLQFEHHRFFNELLGRQDEHLHALEKATGVKLSASGTSLVIVGDEAQRELAGRVASQLYGLLQNGYPVYPSDVDYAIRILSRDRSANLKDIFLDTVYISSHRRTITPKSIAQKAYIDAIRNFDIVFGIGPAGTGKCIAGSSLVLTTQGFVPIQTLAAGSGEKSYTPIDLEVSGLQGVERASHLYTGGRARTKRITTRFGFEIEVTPEHPLLRRTPTGASAWQRAEDLQSGDFVAIQRGQRLFGKDVAIHFVYRPNGRHDHAKSITINTLDEDLAYLLGLLTGDGCLTFTNRVILSSADEEILDHFQRMAQRLGLHVFRNGGGRPYDRIIASAQFYQLLLHLGMSNGRAAEKQVPAAILRAPREIVVAFLRGLFDTDGTVNRRDGYPVLFSVSKILLDQVQVLLLNFGILANKRRKWTLYKGERRLSYQLEITGADADHFYAEIGFALPRKQVLQQHKLRNTNIDVVPYVEELVQTAVEGAVLTRAVHKRLDDYKAGRRRPGYEKLNEILQLIPVSAPASSARATLQELYAQRLFWAEITEIQEGEAHVYDLTVPGTHSFCANGFVNHNTYLAMAVAVADLMKHKVNRVVLTRPAVEAGEKLGFLPGDLAEKINPYLRPLYDALHDMVDFDKASKMIERGTIEVAPLAFMRGRTLNDSFVILDEAQNTTPEQMKMFLTRLGYGSKAVITGDVTQIDLPTGTRSGLKEAQRILRGIDGINFSFFSEKDVVRHRLVQDIITAYERAQEERERLEEEKRELRRLQRQARSNDRHLRQGAWNEPDRTTSMGADSAPPSESTPGGTQPRVRDGSGDPRPEPPVPPPGQTD
jgi:phosphate starvation-inducible protein PhoH